MTSFIPSAVFLDRDGTIIEDTHFIKEPRDVRLLRGAAEAIARLNKRHVPVIVATNQSGIARGLLTEVDYENVRLRLNELLAERNACIDRSYFCPHHPDVGGPCPCRKPATKMFRDAIHDFLIDPKRAAYIGDRWRDVAAAKELGGRGILIGSSMTSEEDRRLAAEAGIESAADLQEAVDRLLTLTDGGGRE